MRHLAPGRGHGDGCHVPYHIISVDGKPVTSISRLFTKLFATTPTFVEESAGDPHDEVTVGTPIKVVPDMLVLHIKPSIVHSFAMAISRYFLQIQCIGQVFLY